MSEEPEPIYFASPAEFRAFGFPGADDLGERSRGKPALQRETSPAHGRDDRAQVPGHDDRGTQMPSAGGADGRAGAAGVEGER